MRKETLMKSERGSKYLRRGEIIILSAVFLAVLGLLYYTFFTPNYYRKQAPVKFEINRGESLNSVADRLYDLEIIPSKSNMRIAAFIYGAEKRIRAARYYIPDGLSYLDLLDLFIKGEAEFLRSVKIFNGMTTELIASRMRTDLLVDSAEFIKSVSDDSLAELIGPGLKSLNGFLLPGEYYFYEKSSPAEILAKFVEEFNKFVSDSLTGRVKARGHSLNELMTIGSIIEGETNSKDEMPLIAGVYYNRLKIGMRLQADPTIQYLLKSWRRLTYKDLRIDSPFNTYKYAGLPPHPINNPGKNAIMAAFNPAEHKYLYFVADTLGGHQFSRTYSEHLKKAGIYRKWLNRQKK